LNPFVIIKRFIRWEILDLSAMMDSINVKSNLELKKVKKIKKKEDA